VCVCVCVCARALVKPSETSTVEVMCFTLKLATHMSKYVGRNK